MKPYPKNLTRFSKEQLIFIVEVMITSAIDAVDSSRPENIDMPKSVSNTMFSGILEKLGFDLSIFYAKITNDGIGCSDVLEMTRMEDILEKFADTPKSIKNVDTNSIATSFVEELFKDYLGEE